MRGAVKTRASIRPWLTALAVRKAESTKDTSYFFLAKRADILDVNTPKHIRIESKGCIENVEWYGIWDMGYGIWDGEILPGPEHS